jgi:hypothetical protein
VALTLPRRFRIRRILVDTRAQGNLAKDERNSAGPILYSHVANLYRGAHGGPVGNRRLSGDVFQLNPHGNHPQTFRSAVFFLRTHAERSDSTKLRGATPVPTNYPVPIRGARPGACPGYILDHITALKHGGEDVPANMQWQSVEESRAKDRVE